MAAPLAFLLTWRTYGSWLHGDPRGSVDWQHSSYGTPILPTSDLRRRHVRGRMKHAALLLDDAGRQIVATTIRAHCRLRGWDRLEDAVRTNHVHLVVAHAGIAPEAMLSQFKAYATRALRTAGLLGQHAPAWSEGGSTRYLWMPEQVTAACAYVRDGQDVPR